MNLRKLSDKAKQIVEQRGGAESLKADAEKLKNIARGEGTLSDKGRRAAEALREPGARRSERVPRAGDAPPHGEPHPTGPPRAEPDPGGPPGRPR